MSDQIPHSRPRVGLEEEAGLAQVLASGYLSRGPRCQQFEAQLAQTVGKPYSHSTSSGTAALHLALIVLGAKPGTNVLLPSLACAALLNAVRYTGAEARLYDCSYEIADPKAMISLIDEQSIAAIIVTPPHHFTGLDGYPADAKGYASVNGTVPVLLDRCQQLSAQTYRGPQARLEVFSFYATKCICTASGGAVAAKEQNDIDLLRDLNDHDGRQNYDQPRFNYQFDEVRAALGLSQLAQLNDFVAQRREHAAAYAEAFGHDTLEGGMPYRYLYDAGSIEKADRMIKHLKGKGIEAKRPVFKPLHRYLGHDDKDFPATCAAWERNVSLPLYPSLSVAERSRVIDAVKAFAV